MKPPSENPTTSPPPSKKNPRKNARATPSSTSLASAVPLSAPASPARRRGTGPEISAVHPDPVPDGPSVLTALRDIQSGARQPNSLSMEDRQRCVEHLTTDGYQTAEIAAILKVAERTVLRDRKAIRKANALQADEGFAAETVGNLIKQADQAIARLRRISREKDTPPAVKVDAERASWGITRDTVELLQRLGHLPTAVQEIRGELTHRLENAPELEILHSELERLEGIVTENTATSQMPAELLARVAQTKNAVARLAIADSIHTLSRHITTEGIANETPSE
jgi:DNA-binding CsgD family transcriptional regulator